MNDKTTRWSCIIGALYFCACSASAPPGARPGGPGSNGSSTTGPGGSQAGNSAFDNGTRVPGQTAGSAGSSGSGPVTPPVDPNAPTFTQDDTGMSGLDAPSLQKLKTGGATCTLKPTYPYDNTIFPGGLLSPTIMWDGGGDAAYVHFTYLQSDKVDYQFAAKLSSPASIQIPRAAWNEITRRTNNFPLEITLNVLSGGNLTSSCKLQWNIAPGNMIGALYYNTYQAPPPGVANEGAVMRQTLGSQAEIYKQFTGTENAIPGTGPCYSCHSVSFNGSTLVASYHDYSAQVFRVEKYDVQQTTQPMATGMLDNANFGALTPDGKRILAMGNPQCTAGSDTFPRKPNNFPLVEGPVVARLLDTQSGADTNAMGLNKDYYMWMPQFSPDGTKVVFNHAKPDGNGGTDRRELAIMDYDAASNTFSNLKVIISASKLPGVPAPSVDYSPGSALGGVLSCGANMCSADGSMGSCDSSSGMVPVVGAIPGIPGDTGAIPMGSCTGPCYPAWPFFTPDDKGVVFSMISEPDFSQAFPGRDKPSLSELWYVDLETLQAVRLDTANSGLKDIDKQNNYYPTVMPVAVGGYFWVFWTAVRDYGNKLSGRDPNASQTAADEAIKKRIWAAAIKPKPTGEFKDTTLTDPSSPGFYLDGQSESGNVRAFAALNPCMQNGATCTSGLDCCCGYCHEDDGAMSGTCTCDVPMCAKINEKCKKDSDCCPPASKTDPTLSCLGGYCGFIQVN